MLNRSLALVRWAPTHISLGDLRDLTIETLPERSASEVFTPMQRIELGCHAKMTFDQEKLEDSKDIASFETIPNRLKMSGTDGLQTLQVSYQTFT